MWETHGQSESKNMKLDTDWGGVASLTKYPTLSSGAGTRKMVNYAGVGQSQRKLWWRLVAVLTCKSLVELGYRGERLIEPSSSWFPPKFLSG